MTEASPLDRQVARRSLTPTLVTIEKTTEPLPLAGDELRIGGRQGQLLRPRPCRRMLGSSNCLPRGYKTSSDGVWSSLTVRLTSARSPCGFTGRTTSQAHKASQAHKDRHAALCWWRMGTSNLRSGHECCRDSLGDRGTLPAERVIRFAHGKYVAFDGVNGALFYNERDMSASDSFQRFVLLCCLGLAYQYTMTTGADRLQDIFRQGGTVEGSRADRRFLDELIKERRRLALFLAPELQATRRQGRPPRGLTPLERTARGIRTRGAALGVRAPARPGA